MDYVHKILVLAAVTAISFLFWLTGYNSGFNHGYDLAQKLEQESCAKQMKSLENGSCHVN